MSRDIEEFRRDAEFSCAMRAHYTDLVEALETRRDALVAGFDSDSLTTEQFTLANEADASLREYIRNARLERVAWSASADTTLRMLNVREAQMAEREREEFFRSAEAGLYIQAGRPNVPAFSATVYRYGGVPGIWLKNQDNVPETDIPLPLTKIA